MAAKFDHYCIRVDRKEYDAAIAFFKDVFGLEVTKDNVLPNGNRQCWIDFLQMNEVDFDGPEGRHDHLSLAVEDRDQVIALLKEKYGAEEMPQGFNWLRLPNGFCFELAEL